MSLIKRKSIVDKAVLTATGNSTVICGSSTEVLINTSDMITLDGTPTRDWTKAGSMAILNMMSNSTVLYAELIWYSTVASTFSGAVDVRSIQDNPITFTMPNGDIKYVTPDYGEDFVTFATGETVRFRGTDVTNIISSYLGGSYTVSNVPTSIPPQGINNSRCGWSLNVIYRNDALPPKKIDFLSGIGYSTATVPYQTTIAGFTTPSNSSYLKGQMLITVANGLPLSGNETVSIGPSMANLTILGNKVGTPNANPLTAPNNPYNNFFSGQINNCNTLSANMGLIDITGTNGTNNNNAFVPSQIVGARNKWDMTAIDISNTLTTDQTQLAFQLVSGQYSVQIMSIGTQINAVAPDVTAVLNIYDSVENNLNTSVGENLVYTISVANDGEMAADNVIVSLDPGSYASVIPGSLRVNNVVTSGDITSGINIGTIGAHGLSRMKFEVNINSLPPLNPSTGTHTITNSADYSYQFVSGVTTITNNAVSNSKTVTIEDGAMTIVKSSSSLNPTLGDNIVYTNAITNTGTQTLKNIVFQDVDTPYTSFVNNSVYINGVLKTGLDPTVGFSLNDMAVEDVITVEYSVTVDSVPPSAIINTSSTVKYSYSTTDITNSIYATETSNILKISVKYSQIMKTTCPNNDYVNVGDTVTYTTNLTNAGNISASNVLVKDTPVPGTTFVNGSVTVNGVPMLNADPYAGFTLTSPIDAGATTVVKYNVTVDYIQSNETIDNTAQIPFQYRINDQQGIISDEKISNTVETLSNFVCITMNESVNRSCATINDVLYYTVNITNTGNINAANAFFASTIQSDSSFVPGSVTINGIPYPDYNPVTGFNIGVICSGNTIQVKFAVIINNVPSGNELYNKSDLSYSYLPNPSGTAVTGTASSNKVSTTINESSYTVNLTVDKTYAVVGDSLVYTSTLNNTGSTDLYNISFFNNLPSYIQFTSGTVYVNGTNYQSYNPTTGFTISELHPGDTAIVVFAATVISSPVAGYIINSSEFTFNYKTCSDTPEIAITAYSNEVRTFIVDGMLYIKKSVNKNYAIVGDIINYSFDVSNIGNVPLTNVQFTDNIDSSLQFVTGSVIVNNVSKPNYNPVTGFSLGNLSVGQTVKISFQASVIKVPNPNTVSNYAVGTFQFTIDPNQQPVVDSVNSNTVTTVINKSDPSLIKKADKSYAALNDIITYTITAVNKGTVSLTNIKFTDILQSNLQFVTDSVYINGVQMIGYNPNSGFVVNDIPAYSSSVIVFQAKVISIPSDYNILNTASMTYEYILIPGGQTYSGSQTSNTVTTVINTLVVSNIKSVDKNYISNGEVLTYTSTITNNSTVALNNCNFTDAIPFDTNFVSGSVTINNVAYPNYNPQDGFSLGNLSPSQSVKVIFKVQTVDKPSSQIVSNASNVSYNYKLYPDKPDTITGNTPSNIVTTLVKVGEASIIKSADREYGRINDIVTYTINIANIGNTILENIVFKDTIQSDSTLVANSVYVDGVQILGVDPSAGFSLENLAIGGFTTVEFQVKINSIPAAGGKLYNTSSMTYSYYVNPDKPAITGSNTSNTTEVSVLDTIISVVKEVDKTFAKVGDVVNYTVTITNKGTVSAQTVNFNDILDSNLKFLSQSVYINGVQYASYNPNTGFTLSDIAGGASTKVEFAATIMKRPLDNTIYNSADLTYTYTIAGVTYNGTMQSNIVSTVTAYGELTIIKSSDKLYGSIGDNINYTVIVKNTGSVDAYNMTFQDVIQSDALFNAGSVTVDNVSYPSYDPNSGFALTNLLPLEAHVVSFSAKITSLPSSGKIDNIADTTFTYKLSDTDNPVTMTANSNMVSTYVNLGKLIITKVCDKQYATIGDILTYTLNVTNSGNVISSNVLFKDIVQSDAEFVAQSVTINDSPQISYNPNTGFDLPNIAAGASVKVTFKVQVKSVPTGSILYNTGTTSYSYISNPDNAPVNTSAASNTVETIINLGKLTIVKAVDKDYATVGDIITYTVDITNSGTVDALAVNFRDVLKTGLTFVPGSVTVGGVSYPSYDPYNSFTVGKITPGQSVQVKFKASVTSIPNPNIASNTANIVFSYYINPDGSITTVDANSNTVTTTINSASMSITKAVDKSYAVAGEVLTYNFVLTNTGNVDLTNANFIDNIPSDVTFNVGSVIVNGTAQPSYDPTVGINLGTIATLAVVNISFKVTVIESPVTNSIINSGYVTYSYKINPSGESYSGTAQSNTVNTILVLPYISANKSVDLLYAAVGDTINYTIIVKNTGNYLLTSVNIVDTLSNGGTFIAGSVYIDNVNYPSYNPISGFNLSDLIPGNSTIVKFAITDSILPSPPVILNYAVATAKAVITQTGTTIDVSAKTNEVTTNILQANLSSVKTVDKNYARVGDTIVYTSVITNTGNVTASSLLFKDILQSELTFVPNSVFIGGVQYPALNPSTGFSLSNLAAGSSVTVSFSAVINALPVPPVIKNTSVTTFKYKIDPSGADYSGISTSNTEVTNVVKGELTAVKSVDKTIATVGDELTYTVTLTNSGNIAGNDIVFTDTLSSGAAFKSGSVTINGVSQPDYNPITGFSVPSIAAGNVTVIVFKATVTSVPTSNSITNTASTAFSYVVDPKQPPYTSTVVSNTVTTSVALSKLDVVKAVDKNYATIGDKLTYTITIKNIGNVNATSVQFIDATPANTTFVTGSVTVNGVSYIAYNPDVGFSIGTIVPGQTVTIVYQVQVNNQCSNS